MALSRVEFEEAVLTATGHRLKASSRFADGAFSISYKVSIEEDPDIQYVVQLRHHGNVTSMILLMSFISSAIDPSILPLPTVYPIPGEGQRQKATGMGRQITRFIQGSMAKSVYPCMSHEEKLIFVRHMALAFQATWHITLDKGRLIGELCAAETDDGKALSVGLYRHYNMGPHNVIVSVTAPTDIKAIIDWEFVASAPYASLHSIIEMVFGEYAPDGFGAEYAHADELGDAFWGAISEWKARNPCEATEVFLEWFRFGLFMKAEWRPHDLNEETREGYRAENVRVVEGLLGKYGAH